MAVELTPTQQRVLEFINEFRGREQCNPTCAEIARQFGWASENSAGEHLIRLEVKGVIERRLIGKSRRYVVTRKFMETATV